MSALSNYTAGGVTGVYSFTINSAPPYTTLKTFINGVDYSPLVSPGTNGFAGSPLVTDKFGAASGKIIIIKSYGSLSEVGSFVVSFLDPTTNLTVTRFTIEAFDSSPDTTVDSTRGSSVISSNKSAAAEADIASAAKLGGLVTILTPLTQTFFVDGTKYPKGIFASSIDLWFATKDAVSSIAIQLRKVTGGVPSSNEVISGSTCVIQSSAINVPANPILTAPLSDSSTYTRFPILAKLPPGEYGISILTDSKNYSIYSSVFGEPSLPVSRIAQKEPYIGKLFKSQNTNTWLEESNKSLCFSVNKAVFNKGTAYFEMQSEDIPTTYYDAIYLKTSTTGEGDISGISYTFNSVNEYSSPGNLSGAVSINQNTATNMLSRKKAIASGDMKLGVTFTNDDADVSPVLDKSKLALLTFANLIDPYETDTRDAELYPSPNDAPANKRPAFSRYLSKVVTLSSGFDSTGLEVKLDVNRKTGTDIEVFCRVMSGLDINSDNTIDNLQWRRMPVYNQSATATAPDSIEGIKSYAGLSNDFTAETYKILETDSEATTGIKNLNYTALVGETLTTFKDFNKFQIKVVFYSIDTTIVPKIKNLIATAVI